MNFSTPAKGITASIVLYLVLSLACTEIPLFNYLGFEFALVVALAGSLISGLLTADALHRFVVNGKTGGARSEFRKIIRTNLLLLSIPFLVMTANALRVKNCSLMEGTAFFFLLPVVSV